MDRNAPSELLRKLVSIMLGITILMLIPVAAEAQYFLDISDNGWAIWPDEEAEWETDRLYPPPVDVEQLPVNPPGSGWSYLRAGLPFTYTLPATVESLAESKSNETFKGKENYAGVSWYCTWLDIPGNWRKERISLQFEGFQKRIEVYLNEELVGYDLVAGTSYEIDITPYVVTGDFNFLALRITDPVGAGTVGDSLPGMWKDYMLNPSIREGGVTGKVTLYITDQVMISDIHVRNMEDAGSVQVLGNISNHKTKLVSGDLKFKLLQPGERKEFVKKVRNVSDIYGAWIISRGFIPDDFPLDKGVNQETWSPENPFLYTLRVEWKGRDWSRGAITKKFGFRSVTVDTAGGKFGILLNGSPLAIELWSPWKTAGYPGISNEVCSNSILFIRPPGNPLGFSAPMSLVNTAEILNQADSEGLIYFHSMDWYTNAVSEDVESIHKAQISRQFIDSRSRPSLLFYHFCRIEESRPGQEEIDFLKSLHELDPSRFIVAESGIGTVTGSSGTPVLKPGTPTMYMLPFDDTIYFAGWE